MMPRLVVLGALLAPSLLIAQDTTRTAAKRPRTDSLAAYRTRAEQGWAPREQVAADPAADYAHHLFPPELIMQNQSRLKLTETQRNAILQEIYKLQATATQVQWRVADEAGKLNELLERETVTESEVLSQAERMMSYEVAVKRAQLGMLVRIRNLLTPEQKETLRALRRRE